MFGHSKFEVFEVRYFGVRSKTNYYYIQDIFIFDATGHSVSEFVGSSISFDFFLSQTPVELGHLQHRRASALFMYFGQQKDIASHANQLRRRRTR